MHASLNRVYRLIWSHVNQTWIIVSEKTKGKGKAPNRKLIATAVLTVSNLALAAPMDGQITSGSGTISQNGSTTTITQNSQNLSLGWGSFNTASHETVTFVQPSASAIAVNRIYDTNPTQFLGRLNANGQVYLINPNGVLFGAGSQINVGGLVASTLNISDAALNSATRNFSGVGSGSIINQGSINTVNGGYVAFIGNTVSNQGTINAPQGKVAFGAGNDVTLSFAGDSLVKLQVNQSTLNNLAENGGLIQADGGAVWLSAGAKDAVLASAVNNTGIIQARSVQEIDGVIVLEAGSAGVASNSGTLDASGKGAGQTGGTAKLLGGEVKLATTGKIDVSGDAGGGTAYVGGNFLGTGPEQNAKTTTVEAGSSINADAITTGNGGNVAVWSDGTTQFNGSITARGGSTSGNGGQVETSGKKLNIKRTASVSTAAPKGQAGNWLLDPDDITIGDSALRSSIDPNVDVNVDTYVLTVALNNGNVTIKTTGSTAICTGITCTRSGSGNGDIIILDPIGIVTTTSGVYLWTTNSTLTLSAYRNVEFAPTYNITYAPYSWVDTASVGMIQNTYGGTVTAIADNSATGTGKVIFGNDTGIYVNHGDGGTIGTVNIYYTPDSYNSPGNYAGMDPTGPGNQGHVYADAINEYMAINVTGSAASKTYDGLLTTAVSGLTSLLQMPNGLTLNTGGAQASFADKNVGTDKTVTITGVTATGNGAINSTNSDGFSVVSYGGEKYYFNGLDSKTATITAKTISVNNVTVVNKTYDGSSTATLSGGTITGLVHGDPFSLAGGTGTFSDANVGAGKTVTVSGYYLDGDVAGNYNLVQPTNVTGTIDKANLTLTGSKTYDGTTIVAGSTLIATGAAGETFSVTGTGDSSNLLSKNVQGNSLLNDTTGLTLGTSSNGGLSSNYNVLSTTGSAYTVTAKSLTLSGITASDKVYDATTAATLNTTNVAYSGLISGDTVGVSGTGNGTFLNKDVGDNIGVTVTGYTLSGGDAGNYVLTQPTGLTASISKADLVVSGISAADKTYDATTNATLSGTASVTGLLADIVSVSGTGTGSFANANAATGKTVIVTGYTLSGSDAGNYNVVQPTNVTATINKADLTLTGTKVYDGTTSVAGSTLTANGVAGQTFSVTGSGDVSNLSGKDVQTNSVLSSLTGLSLGTGSIGALSNNYNVLSTSGSSFSVTPKGIVLTGITASGKVYDTTNAATLNTSNAGYSGMITGDDVMLSGVGVGTFDNKDAGTNKVVTVSGYTLSGGDAGNYVVAQPSGLRATISQADLALSGLSAAGKVYDGTTSAVISGFASVTALGSDVISLGGIGVGSFADKNVGNNKAVTVSGYSLSGTDAGNYNLVAPSSLAANITPASIVVSGITASDKVFDSSTVATINTANAILAGKIGNDVLTISSTGTFSDAAVGENKTVTLNSTYGGADAGNYVFSNQTTTLASITAAPQITNPNPAPTQQIQNVVTQIQSAVLPPQASAQPQVLNLSSTLVVQQTGSGDASTERSQEQAKTPVINTASGFGTPAPLLQIQNGGMQLPLIATSITE